MYIHQVDQGLNAKLGPIGFSGGLYNKVQASYTKFMELPIAQLTYKDVWVDRKAPITVVLHGKAGNILGDAAR
jgi:hypothetical protein